MSGGIRVDLEALCCSDVICRFQQRGPKRHDLLEGCLRIVDVQIDMDLLRRPVGPLRCNVVGSELNTDAPFAIDDNAVPIVLGHHSPIEQTGPERAPRMKVGTSKTMTSRLIRTLQSFPDLPMPNLGVLNRMQNSDERDALCNTH